MTELFVFDTSAILTFTDAEPGVDQIDYLKSTKATQCRILAVQVSLMELYYKTGPNRLKTVCLAATLRAAMKGTSKTSILKVDGIRQVTPGLVGCLINH